MLFVIDVGNTQSTLGVYSNDRRYFSVSDAAEGPAEAPRESSPRTGGSARLVKPSAMWRISTNKTESADDIRAKLRPLFDMANLKLEDVEAAVVASVVPALTAQWCHMLHDYVGVEPELCTAASAMEAGLFACDYPNPAEIGADRVADAIAVRSLYGSPAIVVDFGTATNIEVIDANGRFVGGIIAPGISTGAEALFSNATRLAATALVAPKAAIGKNTEEAIQAGIVLGEAGRIDALVSRIHGELGCTGRAQGGTCSVVATGGLASIVAAYSEQITDVVPELTLEGMRILASRSQNGTAV